MTDLALFAAHRHGPMVAGVIPSTLALFAAHLNRRGNATSTQRSYVREVGSFLAYTPDEPITTHRITTWMDWRGGSSSTLTRALSGLKAYFRSIGDRAALAELEQVERPKRKAGKPRPVEDIEDIMLRMPSTVALCAVVLLETGLRIAEAYSLSFDGEVPEVFMVTGKGSKDRILVLTKRARAALTALGGRLPWTPGTLQRKFRPYGFSPHKLRHTHATLLVQSGVDIGVVAKMLGHSSPATTMAFYAAYDTSQYQEALEKMRLKRLAG